MPSVTEVVRRYGGAYLERFGADMPAAHRKVLAAIAACRTGELGLVIYRCECCGQVQAMGRSCGDRHCPACQRNKAEAWLENQTARLLPCPYFLVTFTLPATLLTLGLFIFVINGLLFWFVGSFIEGFHVSGFWWGMAGAIAYSIVSWALSAVLLPARREASE